MHAYATDAEDRKSIPIWLTIVAVAAALLFDYTLKRIGLKAPWWLDTPAVMGFYGLLHLLFDKYAWRWPLKLSAIPDLNGTWVGTIKSSYDGGLNTDKINVVLYIFQTWSKLSARLETDHSRSFSTMAALNTDASPEQGLKYEYLNEPMSTVAETMHSHRGTAHLRLSPCKTILEGDYYTGRDRRNVGSLSLRRVSRNCLNRDEALNQASISLSAKAAANQVS